MEAAWILPLKEEWIFFFLLCKWSLLLYRHSPCLLLCCLFGQFQEHLKFPFQVSGKGLGLRAAAVQQVNQIAGKIKSLLGVQTPLTWGNIIASWSNSHISPKARNSGGSKQLVAACCFSFCLTQTISGPCIVRAGKREGLEEDCSGWWLDVWLCFPSLWHTEFQPPFFFPCWNVTEVDRVVRIWANTKCSRNATHFSLF